MSYLGGRDVKNIGMKMGRREGQSERRKAAELTIPARWSRRDRSATAEIPLLQQTPLTLQQGCSR